MKIDMSRRVSVLMVIGIAACAPEPRVIDVVPGPNLAERGQMTAERVCGYCHQVVATRPSAIEAAAPSFMEIANLPGRNRDYLRQFTGERHLVDTIGPRPVPMPTTLLTPEEREEVVAYILAFQQDPATGRLPPVKLEPFE
jgi:hypothetical protein